MSSEPQHLIGTRGLTKRFRRQTAVDAVDLQVPAGSIYGFLGPNGSGKTTTIRMLLGLIRPTSGEVEMLGRPMPAAAAEVLPRVGSLVEGPAFHLYLSGYANLARLDAADPVADPATARDRIRAALERVGLLAAAGKRYRAYSLGMRQRLAIASALLLPRELLVLDEPTNGLDPQGTREVRHLIGQLAAEGATVLVSSHLLSEVEQSCSHVGVMREGRLVWQGPITELGAGAVQTVRLETADPAEAAVVLERLGLSEIVVGRPSTGSGREGPAGSGREGPAGSGREGRAGSGREGRAGSGREGPAGSGLERPRGRQSQVSGVLGEVAAERIVPALVEAGVSVLGFAVTAPSLEDLFVSLTGEGFDVSG